MKVEYVLRGTIFSTVVLLAGCFDSTPPTPRTPPTDAEFHLACVKVFVQGNSSKATTLGFAEIVPVCKCIAAQLQKIDDPDFRLRMLRAFIDADGDPKMVDKNAKSVMNSLTKDSAEYLIEKSKIEGTDHIGTFCRKS
jgi:hypothetical protein